MGMLRMGMQGVSATILNSRNTRKPLKKIQTPAAVPRNNAPVGSDRLIRILQQNATESGHRWATANVVPQVTWGGPPLALPRGSWWLRGRGARVTRNLTLRRSSD